MLASTEKNWRNFFCNIFFGEQQCFVLICKASFDLFCVKWQLLKSCVLLWSFLKRNENELHPMLWNIFTHSYLLAAELLMDANLCAHSLYFHDCSSCFSSTARWLSRLVILMLEAWRGWTFLPWWPWIQLCHLLCSVARHKGPIVEPIACYCKCYYISRLHPLHVMVGRWSRRVEKNLSFGIVACSIERFLRNLKKNRPLIWQPSLNGNRKRDTAAVGRTFLRFPPACPPPQLLFGLLR